MSYFSSRYIILNDYWIVIGLLESRDNLEGTILNNSRDDFDLKTQTELIAAFFDDETDN